jgi:hypothetical protein
MTMTVPTLENSGTEILTRLIFSSIKVFFESRDQEKSHKGQDLVIKKGEGALQPFPVSDMFVKWPLCVTEHCHAKT